MGNAVSWIDRGAEGFRVYIDIPLRKNGLPPLAAAQAASKLLENFNPAAFDPPDPVPEIVARAALRDGIVIEQVVMTENHPPVPVFEDDEMPGPRCANGLCLGD
jgi:hypothetical protein